jgi:hypothetical protein
MQRKLPRFLLLSCVSFCFFTIVFHALAYAQEGSNQSPSTSPLTAQQAQILPTPTIYVLKPLINPQIVQLKENTAISTPTPTIYIAPQVTETPDVTTTPTIEQKDLVTYNAPEIPTVSPTALPSPKAGLLIWKRYSVNIVHNSA